MKKYRDLGGWVLTPVDVRAVGRGGIPLQMQAFQIWQVQNGKVTVMRAFVSEDEALEAVNVMKRDPPALKIERG